MLLILADTLASVILDNQNQCALALLASFLLNISSLCLWHFSSYVNWVYIERNKRARKGNCSKSHRKEEPAPRLSTNRSADINPQSAGPKTIDFYPTETALWHLFEYIHSEQYGITQPSRGRYISKVIVRADRFLTHLEGHAECIERAISPYPHACKSVRSPCHYQRKNSS